MTVAFLVIGIYLSFILDLLIWKVPSEASTYSMLRQKKKRFFGIGLIIVSLPVFTFYLFPLFLAVSLVAEGSDLSIFSIAGFGILIAVAGRIISVYAAIQLHNNLHSKLIRTSLFKWSRNPITVGLHLTILGLVLVFRDWFLWIGFAGYLIYFHYKIKIEERHLADLFGKDYQNYVKQTPRYLGYV